MADIAITASNVVPADTAALTTLKLGQNADAGDIVVYDPVDQDYVLASNASAALSGSGDANNLFMLTSSGVAGQTVSAVSVGNVTVGAVLTKGRWYVLSVGGAISPESDMTSNDFSVLIGFAVTDSILQFRPISTGVQV